MAKLNVKSAFRLCPIRPRTVPHGMQWRGHFYFARVLPYGLCSAPFIFNGLAEAGRYTRIWLLQSRAKCQVEFWVAIFKGVLLIQCLRYACESSLPTSGGLSMWITTWTTSSWQGLPQLRSISSTCHRHFWVDRSHCSKRDILSLIGTLSFTAKVIPAGRTFLRRMIDLSTTVLLLLATTTLDEGSCLDIKWWQALIIPRSGRIFFLFRIWTPAPDLDLYTNSSGSISFGAYCCRDWFNGRWLPELTERSIQFNELYPIVLSASI